MKKHVREVTDRPYGDLKSPFRNSRVGPRRGLKLDEIFTNLTIYEGRVEYDFSGDRKKQLEEYIKPSEKLPPRQPGDIFDVDQRVILVVGRPGIGKTMLSTKILRNWSCDTLFNETKKLALDFKLAFLIKLRMFNATNKKLNLRELLDHSEYSTALSEEAWDYIRHNPKRVLVIFDGFDEYSGRTKINEDDVPYRNNEEDKVPVHILLRKIFSYDDDQYRHNKTMGQQFALKPFRKLPYPVQMIFKRLGKIAFDGIKRNTLIFEDHEMDHLESNGLFHRLPDFRDHPLAEERKQYCFIHLTVQEFLAAKYLVDTFSLKKLRKFVSDHIQKDEWHVVMQFVAGLLAEEKGKSTDIFSDLLPLTTEELNVVMIEDSEERNEILTCWPAYRDKALVMTLFNCMYENKASDREVHPKLAKIGCNCLNFSSRNLSRLDCLALVHALKSVEGILNFDLRFSNLQSLGCNEIAKLLPGNEHNQFGELRRLSLTKNQITDEAVKHLSTALTHTKCKLNTLYLSRNNITDEGVKHLSKALTHTNCKLSSLNLGVNNITDKGVKYLFKALTHTNCKLNSLDLADNNITDKGVKYLFTALTHTNCKLISLDLRYNKLITQEGISLVRSMNINCKVFI